MIRHAKRKTTMELGKIGLGRMGAAHGTPEKTRVRARSTGGSGAGITGQELKLRLSINFFAGFRKSGLSKYRNEPNQETMKSKFLLARAHLDTTTGARAVPARSTSLGRGSPENSRVFTPDKPLRTGTVSGGGVMRPACPRSRHEACARGVARRRWPSCREISRLHRRRR